MAERRTFQDVAQLVGAAIGGASLMLAVLAFVPLKALQVADVERQAATAADEQKRLHADNARLTDELSRVTGERDRLKAERGKYPPGPTPPAPKDDPPSSTPTAQQIDGYVLSVPACTREGADIVCEIRAANQKANHRLWIYKSSRILDSLAGDAHAVCQASIGGGTWTLMGNGASYADIPTNATMSARLKFCGIAQSLQQISLFELHLKEQQIQWPNVPLK